MESASTQAGELGLTFGKALTAEQAAALKQDLVWMEEKEVGGQKVLVPVVYLAAATRDSVSTGAVISAKNVSITGGGLSNTNGTVKASNNLTVDTTGDIANRSGTISGGTVTLRTEGNVVNETTATVRGDDTYRDTTIGSTATITAKDGLSIQAGKDVTIKGGDVNAGGSATIQAGGNAQSTPSRTGRRGRRPVPRAARGAPARRLEYADDAADRLERECGRQSDGEERRRHDDRGQQCECRRQCGCEGGRQPEHH